MFKSGFIDVQTQGHIQSIRPLWKIIEFHGHVKLDGALSSLVRGGSNKNNEEIAANKLPFLNKILSGIEGTETYVHKIYESSKYLLVC